MHYEQLGKRVYIRLMTVSLSGLYYCFSDSWRTRYGMGIWKVLYRLNSFGDSWQFSLLVLNIPVHM